MGRIAGKTHDERPGERPGAGAGETRGRRPRKLRPRRAPGPAASPGGRRRPPEPLQGPQRQTESPRRARGSGRGAACVLGRAGVPSGDRLGPRGPGRLQVGKSGGLARAGSQELRGAVGAPRVVPGRCGPGSPVSCAGWSARLLRPPSRELGVGGARPGLRARVAAVRAAESTCSAPRSPLGFPPVFPLLLSAAGRLAPAPGSALTLPCGALPCARGQDLRTARGTGTASACYCRARTALARSVHTVGWFVLVCPHPPRTRTPFHFREGGKITPLLFSDLGQVTQALGAQFLLVKQKAGKMQVSRGIREQRVKHLPPNGSWHELETECVPPCP